MLEQGATRPNVQTYSVGPTSVHVMKYTSLNVILADF